MILVDVECQINCYVCVMCLHNYLRIVCLNKKFVPIQMYLCGVMYFFFFFNNILCTKTFCENLFHKLKFKKISTFFIFGFLLPSVVQQNRQRKRDLNCTFRGYSNAIYHGVETMLFVKRRNNPLRCIVGMVLRLCLFFQCEIRKMTSKNALTVITYSVNKTIRSLFLFNLRCKHSSALFTFELLCSTNFVNVILKQ